jgi:hypothetical protein
VWKVTGSEALRVMAVSLRVGMGTSRRMAGAATSPMSCGALGDHGSPAIRDADGGSSGVVTIVPTGLDRLASRSNDRGTP